VYKALKDGYVWNIASATPGAGAMHVTRDELCCAHRDGGTFPVIVFAWTTAAISGLRLGEAVVEAMGDDMDIDAAPARATGGPPRASTQVTAPAAARTTAAAAAGHRRRAL
jgi:hypothetical protein